MEDKKTNILKLIISIAVPQLSSLLGNLFTTRNSPWYMALEKPAFNPPSWVFGVVWPVLYLLMGVAVFLVWSKSRKVPGVKQALWAFGIQLLINTSWSFIFFGAQSIIGGAITTLVLWLAIVWTMLKFYPISRVGALLLLPYLLWVSFAAAINIAIYLLN